jgi:protein-S-isoprenylcysteine O-methyltransferase Ste14
MSLFESSIYALLWLSFGIVHSLLASTSAKRIFHPLFGRYYRLSYNLLSALHVGFILIVGRQWLGDNSANLVLASQLDTIIVAGRWLGVGIILAALTQYDLGLFGGLKQLRQGSNGSGDEETLHVAGLHRYVRHPLYLGAYCYLWGGAVDEFGLQTALWGSLYLFVGTWFEERKLISLYGRHYVEYREKVPAIFPIRGRAI